jgi:hypothetical protein
MMPSALAGDFVTPVQVIRSAWIFFGGYWFVAALGRKKTKRSESWGSRLSYTLPLFAVVALLARPHFQRG